MSEASEAPQHRRLTTRLAAALALLVPAATAFGQEKTSAFEFFFVPEDIVGILIVWTLVLFSVFVVGYSVKLFFDYRKSTIIPEDTQDEIEALLAERKYSEAIAFVEEDESYLGKLMHAALSEAANGFGAMERAIEETGDAETTRMLRPIEYLNVLGNISPMMGLFGTVYGMILAFQKLVEAGGSPDPAELAGGISTALVTTLWGLVVAIPSLAAYAIIRNKIDALTTEGIVIAEELIAPFKPSKRKSSSSSSSSRSRSRERARPRPEPAAQQ